MPGFYRLSTGVYKKNFGPVNFTQHPQTNYIGRFAPTPSGQLHAGSLLVALASWLDAKANAGLWRLRLDNLDEQRCKPQHAAAIQYQLEQHGLHWDGTVHQQSDFLPEYRNALDSLSDKNLTYFCHCTRAQLAEARRVSGTHNYGRTCADKNLPQGALRFGNPQHTPDMLDFDERIIPNSKNHGNDDFVVRRADGVIGYHLASSVDDQIMGTTHILRGRDLLPSGFCQLALMNVLQIKPPLFIHLGLILDEHGNKMSKQNHAPTLDNKNAYQNLLAALTRLNHPPPTEFTGQKFLDIPSLLDWSVKNWNRQLLPKEDLRTAQK